MAQGEKKGGRLSLASGKRGFGKGGKALKDRSAVFLCFVLGLIPKVMAAIEHRR